KKNYDSEKAKKIYQEKLKSQGKLTKKDRISQRREKILNLLLKGLKRKDIYTLLNISLKTYKRDIQFLKEQGLI
ncbi:DNA-binding response regulator, partial [Clostridium perfringens]